MRTAVATVAWVIILGTLLWVYWPGRADAQAGGIQVAVVGTTADPAVEEALMVADDQWRAAGFEPDCELRRPFRTFDSSAIAAGASDRECEIMWSVSWLAENLGGRRHHDVYVRRAAYDQLCHAAVHEKGHLLGYADQDPMPMGGVMHYDTAYTVPLDRCAAWVDLMAPLPVAAVRMAEVPIKGAARDIVLGEWPCGPRCKAKARKFAKRRQAAICQKAYTALTAGRTIPKVCSDSSRKR